MYRNRRLGEFLKELDLCEGHSTGIPTIQINLEKNGSSKAIFYTDEERKAFRVEIPLHSDFVKKQNMNAINDPINDSIKMTFMENKVLEMLKKDGTLSRKKLSEQIGCAEVTIKRAIEGLIGKEIIVREGSKKTGTWKIKKRTKFDMPSVK